MKKQFIIAIAVIFVLLSVAFYTLCNYMPAFSFATLEAANAIMAALALIAWMLVMNKIKSNPSAFVRGVSGSSFLKLMVCMIAMLAYAVLNKGHIHMQTVFVLCGIYAVYSVTETLLLSKIARD
jgi:hypothetical protein